MNTASKLTISNSLKVVLLLFVIALVGVQLFRFYWPTTTIALAGHSLHVQVADNAYRHHRGLSGRESLVPYDGMLFIFPFAKPYAFVMRGMKFPLDIIWLNQGVVVDIAPNLPPEDGVPEEQLRSYLPRKAATMVLEVKAGWVAEKGIKIGDTLTVLDK